MSRVDNGRASQTNKEPINGGAISANNLKLMVDSSYQPTDNKQKNINGYLIDNDNSGDYVSTYHNPQTKHAVIIHRGTKGVTDWLNNGAYALGMYDSTERFNNGKKVQDAVYGKYGKENVSTVGHSQGSILARRLGKDSKEIININPAYLGEKPAYNEYDVKSSGDPVSVLKTPYSWLYNTLYPSTQGNILTIPSAKPYNPLVEHKASILLRLPPNQMIGR